MLGYGTWSAFGAGRVLVGYNGSDTDFNAAEKTGGAKTVASNVTVNAHTTQTRTTGSGTALNGPVNHTVTNNATSVVQPYLVVYMWKRTA